MYATITEFGASINNAMNDPATYCVLDGIESQFLHGGGTVGFAKGNMKCSEYMSSRCAQNWDELCEAFSETTTVKYPRPQCCPRGLTDGEAFVREAAFKKYLLRTKNCFSVCEPFDPTVADSPMICYFLDTAPTSGPSSAEMWLLDGRPTSGGPSLDYPPCEKVYGFTEEQMNRLDADPLMNKLLSNPNIAIDLLKLLAIWVTTTRNVRKVNRTRFWCFVSRNRLFY